MCSYFVSASLFPSLAPVASECAGAWGRGGAIELLEAPVVAAVVDVPCIVREACEVACDAGGKKEEVGDDSSECVGLRGRLCTSTKGCWLGVEVTAAPPPADEAANRGGEAGGVSIQNLDHLEIY
jgi:hypothetical protein